MARISLDSMKPERQVGLFGAAVGVEMLWKLVYELKERVEALEILVRQPRGR